MIGPMIPLRRHRPTDYESLLEVLDAHAAFKEPEMQAVQALGDVAVSMGVEQRFGACMLHRHFMVNDGEVLVERSTGNQDWPIRTAPEQIARGNRSLVPTMMMLSSTDEWVGMEFAPSIDVEELSKPRDEEFLKRASEMLSSLGLSRSVGLFVPTRTLRACYGRFLVENAYESDRVLAYEATDEAPDDVESIIDTRWMWESLFTEVAIDCRLDITTRCSSQCRSFTVTRCNAYADQPGHNSTPEPRHDSSHTSHTDSVHRTVH